MKPILIVLSIFTVLLAGCTMPVSNPIPPSQLFSDPNLELLIRNNIGKPSGVLTKEDVQGIISLSVNDGPENSRIFDLSGMENLKALQTLDFTGQGITDLKPLRGLTQLIDLRLKYNRGITDFEPLMGLNQLKIVILSNTNMSDLTSLIGLTSLENLELSSNYITNIKPLVDNSGFGASDKIDLRWNNLDEVSKNTYIPDLEKRGVTVTWKK